MSRCSYVRSRFGGFKLTLVLLSLMPDEAVCLFCGDPIADPGEGFYAHVEEAPSCRFRWEDWMVQIPKDHGGA